MSSMNSSVEIKFGPRSIVLNLEHVRQHVGSLITTACSADWQRDSGSQIIDFSSTLPHYSESLLDSVRVFYATGELRQPKETQFDALSCWSDLHLVPRLPSLLTEHDQKDVASLVHEMCESFLQYNAADMTALCLGELRDLHVAVPILSIQAGRVALGVLHKAREEAVEKAGHDRSASGPVAVEGSPMFPLLEHGKGVLDHSEPIGHTHTHKDGQ
jgi:hypothetical protein